MTPDTAPGHPFVTENPRSTRVGLLPLKQSDYDFLYDLALSPDVLWQWHGRSPGPESFAGTLYADTLVNFVIVDAAGHRLGYVSAYSANMVHGTVSIQIFFHATARGLGWPLEAGALFLDHLFDSYPLRKVYINSPEYYFRRLKGILRFGFEVEGCLRQSVYGFGQYWDVYIAAVTRERWKDHGRYHALTGASGR